MDRRVSRTDVGMGGLSSSNKISRKSKMDMSYESLTRRTCPSYNWALQIRITSGLFNDGQICCPSRKSISTSTFASCKQYNKFDPWSLDSQTLVKYIFNEGNKMINVFEMKISLRKKSILFCLCPFQKSETKTQNGKGKKNYMRGYKFIFSYTITQKTFICWILEA